MSLAFWVCAGVALISALVSLGYAVAGVRVARGEGAQPSRYALARSVALATVAIAALFASSPGFVAAIALAMVVVQGGDAFVGGAVKDRLKTWGPAFTAAVGAATLLWAITS